MKINEEIIIKVKCYVTQSPQKVSYIFTGGGHLSGLGGQKSGKRVHLSGKKVDI